MLISVYNNIWLHLLSILTNIVSFWYAKKCHFMDIIDRKCQFYVYKLTIMDTGTISFFGTCKKLRFGMYATLKSRNGTTIPTPLYLSNPPYLTLCRPKMFDSKYFSNINLFGITIFLDPQYFWTHNFFLLNITLFPRGGT